jgi:phosphatidylinositol alpha-mannosyltransferase
MSSDSYYPHPGGVSEYMHFLSRYLRRLGHDVVILAPHYPTVYQDDPHTKRIGRCYLFNANMATITITFHPRLPLLVRDYMREQHFDVVHTNGPLGWNLPYWAFHYSKAVNIVTFHTAFTGVNLYKYAKLIFKHRFQEKMNGAIYPSITAWKTTHPHFAIPYKIIPNGVDTERFNPDVKALDKFPKDVPKILFLGRLDPRKGLHHLIAAYPRIKKKIPEAILIVVGWGRSLERYKNSLPAKIRDSVYFEGRVPAHLIPRYYATCDVYVSPATGGEVFGIVLAEAMATGKPVAASNIPGYNDVIQHEVNGILFDFNDPGNIADEVSRILLDKKLHNRLSRNGQLFARKISWQHIADQVSDYYNELIKEVK